MGIIDWLSRTSSEERFSVQGRNYLRNPDAWILGAVGGTATDSGISIDEETALEWTALGAAIRILSQTVAQLPLFVFQRREDGGKDPVRDHPVYGLLHDSPNPEITAFDWRGMIVTHGVLWGNHYAEQVRSAGGELDAIWGINPDRVTVDRGRGGGIVYVVSNPGGGSRVVPASKMLHIPGFMTDGLLGRAMVDDHRQSIGLGLITEKYAARFFGNDASPGGVLRHPETLGAEAQARLKTSWESAHRGADNAHRVAVLEEGMEWQQVTIDNERAQFLELRQFQLNEVSRIVTGVPPHLYGDLTRSTFSNIEQQSIEYLLYGLTPWLKRIEQRMNMQLFTDAERAAGLFVEHRVDGLLRGDSAARSQYYTSMWNMGVFSINEIRALENMSPIDEGDMRFVRLDTVPLDMVREVKTPVAPPEPEPEPDEEEEEDEDEARQIEMRANLPQLRIALVRSFESVFRDATNRLVKREIAQIKRALDRLPADADIRAFLDWVQDFYFNKWPADVRRIMGPTFNAYSTAVSKVAGREVDADPDEGEVKEFSDEYLDTFANRYSRSSRHEMQQAVEDAVTADTDPRDAVLDQLDTWVEGTESSRPRDERVSDRERHELSNAVTKFVFVGAGVTALRWMATGGDVCDYCAGLDGVVVSIDVPFVDEGQAFKPKGASDSWTPSSTVVHPPLHNGCNCVIVSD